MKQIRNVRMAFLFWILAVPVLAGAESEGFSVFSDTVWDDVGAADRWAASFDNDFLVPGGRDQDYTYGFSVIRTSSKLDDHIATKPIGFIDGLFKLDQPSRHGIEVGLYGFTPEDIERKDANPDDRPYASLVYASTRAERVYPLEGKVISSQLTVGVLGIDVVGDLQKGLHDMVEGKAPQGWRHQISDGGEPTLRYSLARQKLLREPTGTFELKHTHSVSVGYITEASWGMNFRAGKLNSLWHNFHPEQASYAETSAQLNSRTAERFFWAGFAIKARAYNAFLQGQWRDSDVEYSSGDLRHLILEVWAGYTHGFANGIFVSYSLRGHSSEIRLGQGDRNVIWGGVMIGRNLE